MKFKAKHSLWVLFFVLGVSEAPVFRSWSCCLKAIVAGEKRGQFWQRIRIVSSCYGPWNSRKGLHPLVELNNPQGATVLEIAGKDLHPEGLLGLLALIE